MSSVEVTEDLLKPFDYDAHPERYRRLRLVFVSDTHKKHRQISIPDGDIFFHCGDWTNRFDWQNLNDDEIPPSVLDFNQWLGALKHKHKIVISGNHEIGFERLTKEQIQSEYLTNGTYLDDQLIVIDGLTIFGCSWPFHRSNESRWPLIPSNVDILLTHTPPRYILDLACQPETVSSEPCPACNNTVHGPYGHWGSKGLLREINGRIRPRLHCFGHVHDDAGYRYNPSISQTLFINAAADLTCRAFRFNFYLDLQRTIS